MTSDVSLVGFVGPVAGGLVGIHDLGSVIARRRVSRLGIGIVGRLVRLGLVGRLDLAVLRIDSQEVLLPIGRGIFLAGCRGVEMLGLMEVWWLGGYGSL